MEKSKSFSKVNQKIVQTSLLIALALAVRSLSIMIPFMGAPGMRISFAHIFSRMPAMLFGPFWGGLATGIVDILGFLIRPEGAYIPFLTLTQVLDGVIVGFVFKGIKNIEVKRIQTGMGLGFITLAIIGTVNLVISKFYSQSSVSQALDSMGKRKDYLLLGLIAVAVIGLLLLFINFVLQKKFPDSEVHKYYLKVALAFASAGIPVTILNTYILILFISSLSEIGFVVFLIPRLVEEIFLVATTSYITAFLLGIYDKFIYKKTSASVA